MSSLQEEITAYEQLRARADTSQDITQRDLAEQERRMWDVVPSTTRKNFSGQVDWLWKTFGGSQPPYYGRQVLLNAPDDVGALLWPRVEGKGAISTPTAARLLRDARKRAKEKRIPLSQALRMELYQFDRLPAINTSDGTLIRRRKPGAPIPEPEVTPPQESVPAADPKNYWKTIRGAVRGLLDERLSVLPESQRIILEKEVEAEFRVLMDNVQSKIWRLTNTHKKQIPWADVLRAHTILSMDPPRKKTQPLDFATAQKQFRKLVKLYHPDITKTAETAGQYDQVVQAFQLIQQFIATQGDSSND